MSGDLRIRFAHDVPAMAVDVIAPDLRLVQRVMVQPGAEEIVQVPSEGSFLRAHLPSGEAITVGGRGTLERFITREMIVAARGERERQPHWTEGITRGTGKKSLRLGASRSPVGVAQVIAADGEPLTGNFTPNGAAAWAIQGPPFDRPFELRIVRKPSATVFMRIPGNVKGLVARAEKAPNESSARWRCIIRLETEQPIADTLMNYLARGEIGAAGAMRGWAQQGEEMLRTKMQDPYAAAVGAYLLLRIQEFDLLHDWPRNLAKWFEFLPDGCVIWAWQLIATDPTKESEIGQYLLQAASRGVPVFAEGLRLLLDGLKLLGSDGRSALDDLRARVGTVVRESPLSMWIHSESRVENENQVPLAFDVRFGAQL